MSTLDIGAVVISHLHGDHFGGLPFLLLESQFVSERRKPLILAGPPGLHTRLEMACEVLFPAMTGNRWSFPWHVLEITPGSTEKIAGFDVKTLEVRHPSGAPATGIRVSDREKLFAYSGDTSWMANVPVIADGADLFMCECYAAETPHPQSYRLAKPEVAIAEPEGAANRCNPSGTQGAGACGGDSLGGSCDS